VRIRPLAPDSTDELELVAARMRQTLIEVLGEARGRTLHPQDWLRDRVRWHLDPEQTTARVLLAEADDGHVAGHTIVRVEPGDDEHGLFSTIYVEPESRGQGVATALLRHGEDWLKGQGQREAATHTATTNAKLIRLFEREGYAIVARFPEEDMVRLAKRLGVEEEA
jgi:GNAT superfamily N-acetyltransferase